MVLEFPQGLLSEQFHVFSISSSKLNSGLLACNSLVHLLFHTSIWQLQAVHFLPPSLHFDAYMDLISYTIPYMGGLEKRR